MKNYGWAAFVILVAVPALWIVGISMLIFMTFLGTFGFIQLAWIKDRKEEFRLWKVEMSNSLRDIWGLFSLRPLR